MRDYQMSVKYAGMPSNFSAKDCNNNDIDMMSIQMCVEGMFHVITFNSQAGQDDFEAKWRPLKIAEKLE